MKKKSRNKHLLKKRRKKLLEALARTEGPGGQSDISGITTTPLSSLSVGDPFTYEGKFYTVADAEVAGYIAVIDTDGEQDWLPADIAV